MNIPNDFTVQISSSNSWSIQVFYLETNLFCMHLRYMLIKVFLPLFLSFYPSFWFWVTASFSFLSILNLSFYFLGQTYWGSRQGLAILFIISKDLPLLFVVKSLFSVSLTSGYFSSILTFGLFPFFVYSLIFWVTVQKYPMVLHI